MKYCYGIIFILFCQPFGLNANVLSEQTASKKECVILLHGLARSHHSMWYIKKYLSDKDMHVVNLGYPSTSSNIENLANKVVPESVNECRKASTSRIHFVTHSMGGILLRSYLQENEIQGLHRIIMLAPPNHGSEVVDELLKNRLVKKWTFKSFIDISSKDNSYVNQLKPVSAEIGIITGNISTNFITSPWLTGEDDGKVSVQSACLNEMKAMLVVPTNHTFVTFNKIVNHQIYSFLTSGLFDRDEINSTKAYQVEECSAI